MRYHRCIGEVLNLSAWNNFFQNNIHKLYLKITVTIVNKGVISNDATHHGARAPVHYHNTNADLSVKTGKTHITNLRPSLYEMWVLEETLQRRL